MLCTSMMMMAQSITVDKGDFRLEEGDATANLKGTTVVDRNGDKCALIKIETPKTGFSFEVGGLGVQKMLQKTGQIWLYVPQGIKHITINHPKYTSFDYRFNIPIEKARTYVMKLNVLEEMRTQRINIAFTPANATVLLDDELIEATNGNISMDILQGVHKWNAVCPGYFSQSGTIVLSGNHTEKLTISLAANNKTIAAVDRYKPVQPLPQGGEAANEEEEAAELEPVTFNAGDIHFTMIPVKGGTFMMGATDEQENAEEDELPAHQVVLYDYYIGETEVTQELWEAVMGENPSDKGANDMMLGKKKPVQMVSWDMCQTFVEHLSELTGRKFRLPTEAEWEYAARGGAKTEGTQYSGGSALHQVGWDSDNSQTATHDVKSLRPNELGLYDMSGNVAEWCSDWKGAYSSTPQSSPEGPQSGQRKVLRGGSWNSYSSSECRTSARGANVPESKRNSIGLRLVMQ